MRQPPDVDGPVALKSGAAASQQQIADHIGIRGATLTHHLSGMEERGLVARSREAGDRRTQVVRLTEQGEALFVAMAGAAQEFDRRLRRGIGRATTSPSSTRCWGGSTTTSRSAGAPSRATSPPDVGQQAPCRFLAVAEVATVWGSG
jgi:DNA-binding IclR family transcriptional regulator